MGKDKEAAQDTMKHVISDLLKEAARDAIPPPSLVVPTVIVNIVDHDVATLQSLARQLSWGS